MPLRGRTGLTAALLAASALVTPGAAHAATSREAALEARLDKLEAEMAQLRADLAAEHQGRVAAEQSAQDAQTRAAQADARVVQTETRVAALEAKPAAPPPPAPAAPADGFRSGATRINIGGYIKVVATNSRFSDGEVANNTFGRDFYLPQAIPTGNAPASRVQDFSAKQSRFWLTLNTDVAGHAVKGYVEADFQTAPGTQGSQRTTNGYDFALRRAFMQVDRWTFGQDWSTFQYTGALPESTDYVGATEGTTFVRQPLVRYSAPLGKGTTLHASIEEPASGTTNAGSATLIESGDSRLPDFAARLAYGGKMGELSLSGVARQVRIANNGVAADTFGWAASAGGKLFLASDKSSDLRFMATYGHNAGRYIGLNFAPDAVYVAATNRLESVNEFAALAALRVGLAPGVRTNLIGSVQTVDYSNALSLAQIATYNKRAWSVAANLFYSPVKMIDLGIEYRHGERELVDGANGKLDRLEFAAKYSF